MEQAIRWGILGTGAIAKLFAEGLRALPDAEIAAVGSRKPQTARAFAEAHEIRRWHGSYAELVGDPDVDVIYVATPHPMHMENTMLALEAGKPVLCEKPFTINAGQAEQVVALARRKKLFLMEAMWTRYLPVIEKVRRWLAEGAIGQVRMLRVDFGFRAGDDEAGRLLNPHLGGGALLDVGIYTVSLASMVFGGQPSRIAGLAHIGRTGVDEQSAMVLGYEAGQLAVLSCAIRTSTVHDARIMGTEGRIDIHPMFWRATKASLTVGANTEQVEMPHEGNGYNYEAAEVMRCLRAGLLESETMPLDETIEIMKTMDAIRAQWNLKYPME